jgi:hypothetical protein
MFVSLCSKIFKFDSNVIRIASFDVHYGLFLKREEVRKKSKPTFGFFNFFFENRNLNENVRKSMAQSDRSH